MLRGRSDLGLDRFMFLNLYFLHDSTFRDHNFSDFWNDGGGGAPIERVVASSIEAYLKRSYIPDLKRSGRLEGLPPDFNPIVSMTLSMPCCESFIRANPALPITPRDYYLSKLFQFTYDTLIARFEINLSDSGLRSQLHELFERISNANLPPDDRICWQDVWWKFYADTRACSLTEVVHLLEDHLTAALEGVARSRQYGPLPATDDHQIVAAVVMQIEASGRDWRHELQSLCSELDKRNVPCYMGRERKEQISWKAKLHLPDGKEKVKKAIEYRLTQAEKASELTT